LQARFDGAQVGIHGPAQVRQAGIVVRDKSVSDDQVDNPVRGVFDRFVAGRGALIFLYTAQPKGFPP
jgi:hypothetical protein